jgi:RND family efflux transporter MFP subunit
VEVVTLEGEEAILLIERVGVLRGSAEVEVVPKVAGRIQRVIAVRGQKVARGDVLAVIEQADYVDGLQQAQAGLAVAEANLVQAELNIARQRALFDEGIASDAALEAAESAYRVASAGVRQAQAAFEIAERALGDTRIVSPLEGYVADRMVEVGTFVSPPVAAYSVVALDPLEMVCLVTDQDISRVEIGATADIDVKALPDRRFKGRVTEVSVATDRTSGGFPVTVSVPNPDGILKDGMTAIVDLHVGRQPGAIVVSPDVLIERGGQWYAYVVKDSVAESRRVTPGDWVTGGVIVEDGLEEGDALVVKGQAYLDTGTRVKVEEVGS